MWTWIKSLFSSKKFVVMASSVVAYTASRAGLDVSQEAANTAMGVVGAYLVGQGIADHGKEAQKVRAQTPWPPIP